MPATTPDGLRYPLPGDNPNVPRDIGYLAADTQAALSRLDGRGQVYHGQRGASDQFQGSAEVMGVGSLGEAAPAGSVWLAHLRMVMQPNSVPIHAWLSPVQATNCILVPVDLGAPKLFVSSAFADSWSPSPWTVVVQNDGQFGFGVQFSGGGDALWWINKESAWSLLRVK